MVTRRTLRDSNNHRRVTVIEDEAAPAATSDDLVADAYAGEQEVVTAYPDSWGVARGFLRMLNMWIAFGLLIVETLLAFRLAFGLAGANAANGFVDFIYDVTAPLVAPFEGIASEELTGEGVFEPETVIAMAVYAVAAILVMVFLAIIAAAPRTTPERQVVTRERQTHIEEEV